MMVFVTSDVMTSYIRTVVALICRRVATASGVPRLDVYLLTYDGFWECQGRFLDGIIDPINVFQIVE